MRDLLKTHLALAMLPIAAIAAAPALAGEGGVMTLTIGDATHQFPLDSKQADWSGSETYLSTNIGGRPTDEKTWETYKFLMLGFEYFNNTSGSGELMLTIMDGDQLKRLFSNEDPEEGGLVVTVSDAVVTGDELSISGTIAGNLGASDNFGRDIDLSAAIPFSGTFDVVLGPVE